MKCYSWLAIAVLAMLFPFTGATANTMDLVTHIGVRAFPDDDFIEQGTGIVVADDGKVATIITAYHVISAHGTFAVETGPLDKASVEFFTAQGQERSASLVYADPRLDLAILKVASNDRLKARFEGARKVLLPAEIPVRADYDRVAIIGTKNGVPWSSSERPAPILELGPMSDPDHILFDSDIASGGFSGGPLFTESGALIGMVIEAGLDDAAIDLATIRRVIEREGIAFDLATGDEILSNIARNLLTREIDPVGELELALTSPEPDFDMLHLFWLARLEPDYVVRALRRQISSDGTIAVEKFIKNTATIPSCTLTNPVDLASGDYRQRVIALGLARFVAADFHGSCDAHLKLWLGKMIEQGVDPDMRLNARPSGNNTGLMSMLYMAVKAGNVPLTIALLEAGAAPNPYVDVAGNGTTRMMLLYPLDNVLDGFEGGDRDLVWDAMIKAGVVVVDEVKDAGTRKYEISEGLLPNPPLCQRLAERYRFDWCEWAEGIEEAITIPLGNLPPKFNGKLKTFITADRERAYFYVQNYKDFDPWFGNQAIVSITRDFSEIYVHWFGDNYGCRPNPKDGGESYRKCWREYEGQLAGLKLANQPSGRMWDLSTSIIANKSDNGLSLAMSLQDADRFLTAQGLERKTVGDLFASAVRDTVISVYYSRGNRSTKPGFEEVHLLALNGQLLGLQYDRRADQNDAIGWLVQPKETLPQDSWQEFRLADDMSGREATSKLQMVENLADGSVSLLQRRNIAGNSMSTTIFSRSATESTKTSAYMTGKLNEWLPAPREMSTGLCLDDYRRVRQTKGSRCVTTLERAAQFRERNASSRSVVTVSPMVQYEVLEEGDGPALEIGDSVRLMYSATRLDFTVGRDGRSRDQISSGGETVTVGKPQGRHWFRLSTDLLSRMRVGAKWKAYIYPQEDRVPKRDGVILVELHPYRLAEEG